MLCFFILIIQLHDSDKPQNPDNPDNSPSLGTYSRSSPCPHELSKLLILDIIDPGDLVPNPANVEDKRHRSDDVEPEVEAEEVLVSLGAAGHRNLQDECKHRDGGQDIEGEVG